MIARCFDSPAQAEAYAVALLHQGIAAHVTPSPAGGWAVVPTGWACRGCSD